jgi:hypothetical protein
VLESVERLKAECAELQSRSRAVRKSTPPSMPRRRTTNSSVSGPPCARFSGSRQLIRAPVAPSTPHASLRARRLVAKCLEAIGSKNPSPLAALKRRTVSRCHLWHSLHPSTQKAGDANPGGILLLLIPEDVKYLIMDRFELFIMLFIKGLDRCDLHGSRQA